MATVFVGFVLLLLKKLPNCLPLYPVLATLFCPFTPWLRSRRSREVWDSTYVQSSWWKKEYVHGHIQHFKNKMVRNKDSDALSPRALSGLFHFTDSMALQWFHQVLPPSPPSLSQIPNFLISLQRCCPTWTLKGHVLKWVIHSIVPP